MSAARKFSRWIGLAIAACALTAVAEEYAELTAWMKTNDTAIKVLQKLEKKTGRQAVRAAEQMGGVFENMIGFWRARGIADAEQWSQSAKAAALELATAASAEDAARADAAFQTLRGICQSCHEAHRQQVGEGKYRLK